MDPHLYEEICKLYDLGKPIADVRSVDGGLLHHMWFLQTTSGKYAVKELNAEIMARPKVKENFERSELAAFQFGHAGIPAVVALKAGDEYVRHVGGHFVLVYPWIDGQVLSTRAVTKDQAFLIGKIIGQIHQIDLQMPGLEGDFLKTFSKVHWLSLFKDLKKECFQDSQLESTFEIFLKWNEKAPEVLQRLQKNLVLSHGDIDQKNVVWKDDQHPFILDWEGVGKVNPAVELMDSALNWGGLVNGEVDEESMKAVIQGYVSTHVSLKDAGEDVLMGCVFKWGAWLEHNVHQYVSSQEGGEKRQQAFRQIKGTVRNLEVIFNGFEEWRGLLHTI